MDLQRTVTAGTHKLCDKRAVLILSTALRVRMDEVHITPTLDLGIDTEHLAVHPLGDLNAVQLPGGHNKTMVGVIGRAERDLVEAQREEPAAEPFTKATATMAVVDGQNNSLTKENRTVQGLDTFLEAVQLVERTPKQPLKQPLNRGKKRTHINAGFTPLIKLSSKALSTLNRVGVIASIHQSADISDEDIRIKGVQDEIEVHKGSGLDSNTLQDGLVSQADDRHVPLARRHFKISHWQGNDVSPVNGHIGTIDVRGNAKPPWRHLEDQLLDDRAAGLDLDNLGQRVVAAPPSDEHVLARKNIVKNEIASIVGDADRFVIKGNLAPALRANNNADPKRLRRHTGRRSRHRTGGRWFGSKSQ